MILKSGRTMENYLIFWIFFIPMTSVTLTRSVPFLRPTIILAFGSLALLWGFGLPARYKNTLYIVTFAYIWVFLLGQFGLSVAPPNFDNISGAFGGVQAFNYASLQGAGYILSGFLVFLAFRYLYRPYMMRYILYSYSIFCLYGIFVVLYYDITRSWPDLYPNAYLGTTYEQHMYILGEWRARLCSFTGEPSMFAATLVPVWAMAIMNRAKMRYIILFTVSLLLSYSTTAYLGMLLFYIGYRLYTRPSRVDLGILATVLALVVYYFDELMEFLDMVIFIKLAGENLSGDARGDSFMMAFSQFDSLSIINQLFGVGWGLARYADLFSTALINSGLVGIVAMLAVFLYPMIKLPTRLLAYKLTPPLTLVLLCMAIPELWIHTIWMVLGISYYYCDCLNNKVNPDDRQKISCG